MFCWSVSLFHQTIHSTIQLYIYLSIHLPFYTSIHLYTIALIHLSICTPIHLYTNPSIRKSVYTQIYLYTNPTIHQSIDPFIQISLSLPLLHCCPLSFPSQFSLSHTLLAHTLCVRSKRSSFSQSVSMRDYYIND